MKGISILFFVIDLIGAACVLVVALTLLDLTLGGVLP